MKRFFASILAVLLLVVGVGLAGLGALGISIFGTDGEYQAPVNDLASTDASVAIIADLAGVEIGIPFHDQLGHATISVQPLQSGAVFLGRGSQQDVDSYLFGQPYDIATKTSSWHTVSVPGIETSVAAPDDQAFWGAHASGTTATIPLQPGVQQQTLVIMNVDGTPGVEVQAWLGFAGERIFPYSAASLGIGLILIILAITMLVRIVRRRSRPERIVVVEKSVPPAVAVHVAPPADGVVAETAAPASTAVASDPGELAGGGPNPAQADRTPS